jgi:hypothetical protein
MYFSDRIAYFRSRTAFLSTRSSRETQNPPQVSEDVVGVRAGSALTASQATVAAEIGNMDSRQSAGYVVIVNSTTPTLTTTSLTHSQRCVFLRAEH